MTAQELVNHYNLLPHPEGGWYKETYKSKEVIPANSLPQRFTAERPFSTAIYFLLEQGNFSAFHRIKSDECWHFYTGDPLDIFTIGIDGILTTTRLGNNLPGGHLFQYVVPANCWFASRPAPGSDFCFVGCTVAPGFNFNDFELAQAEDLCHLYPSLEKIIKELCR